ncbi:MAG: tRNA (adenosine(37)-N6)-dimethylallyltransferase MiaA [Rhodothermales bacterium]
MPPIIVLTGPTAIGKTALSLDLARRLDAEIVSVDSRQIYRELNIGTAKPGLAERGGIVHHLIDAWPLEAPLSAGIYTREAEACIRDIVSRGKTPLVVGGSTLYLAALTQGLSDIPDVPEAVRETVMARLQAEGPDALYRELERVDAASAATMDATKTQRLVRALEVYLGTGQPLSYYHGTVQPPAFAYRTIVLDTDRTVLYDRIERRVDAMLANGLVEEVRGLLARGIDPALPALRTIGYQEPIAMLRGEIDEAEMTRLIKRNTRRYAKRQLTWFRRYPAYEWVDVDEAVRTPERLLQGVS